MFNFYTWLIPAVFCFIVADFVSGIAAAFCNGNFQSSCMRTGIWHKCAELMLIVIAIGVQIVSPEIGIEWGNNLVKGVCVYLILMETGSICENIVKINPELSEVMSKLFGGINNGNQE